MLSQSDYITISTNPNAIKLDKKETSGAIASFVKSELKRFKTGRDEAEDTWLEAWANYLGTPEAEAHQRRTAMRVGDVDRDWRHRINVGKAFENVETIHAYLMQATFPSSEWFSSVPVNPGYIEDARIMTKFIAQKMDSARFRTHYANFLRQLLITGNSVMALPWRYETTKWKKKVKVRVPVFNNDGEEINERVSWRVTEVDKVIANEPDFETLDIFDVFLDPLATEPNRAALIRRMYKHRADVIALVNSGIYQYVTPLDIVKTAAYRTADDKTEMTKWFQGIDVPAYSMTDTVEVLEFWGDVHLDGVTYKDVVATVIGDKLVRFENNPYWGGKPFIVGTYIPVVRQPYGIGAIQPTLGALHELNSITNQRLDNLELSVNSMWTMTQDSMLTPEEVYAAPGKVFEVENHDALRPIEASNRFTISFDEAQYQESRIDKVFGAGALIGVGMARGGERVTAAEIQAVRDAGGNRLSGVHKHIEETSLIPLLNKVFRGLQQFVTEEEVVRVVGGNGEIEYLAVGAEDFENDFQIRPLGSDFVTDRERYIQTRLDFLAATAQFEQMSQHVNYYQVLLDIVQHFGFENPDSYIKEQEQTPEAEAVPPEDPMTAQLRNMGGQSAVDGMMALPNATGDMSMLAQSLGGLPPA